MDVGVTLDNAGLDGLVRRLTGLAGPPDGDRAAVLLAGPPGSGKSTLAKAVVEAASRTAPGFAVWAPMDGYHLAQRELDRLGLAERKGAPETFDARGFVDGLHKACSAGWRGELPAYSRRLGEPAFTGAALHRATAETRVVLAEGNYVLLESLPWSQGRELARETWYLDAPWEACHERLRRRHAERGRSPAEIEAKLKNDRRNAKLVSSQSRHADLVLRWPQDAEA